MLQLIGGLLPGLFGNADNTQFVIILAVVLSVVVIVIIVAVAVAVARNKAKRVNSQRGQGGHVHTPTAMRSATYLKSNDDDGGGRGGQGGDTFQQQLQEGTLRKK